MNRYRKIYEHHYGEIPRDDTGRSYEVHHIDGNHKNDSPENLTAITIQEHYDIHYARGDWGACNKILCRMQLSPDEISKICSELSSKTQKKRVADGTHHWLSGDLQRELQNRLVKEGTHHFITNPPNKGRKQTDDEKLQRSKSNKGNTNLIASGLASLFITDNPVYQQIIDGKNVFLTDKHPNKDGKTIKRLMEEGNHPIVKVHTCPHCGKSGKGIAMFTHHFDNCIKIKPRKTKMCENCGKEIWINNFTRHFRACNLKGNSSE